ncbi:hypothetical protein O0L34_g12581 [Tuta absoluta]|nr:hypothetical protein O0L34_g12581 [Tuta absoluta]
MLANRRNLLLFRASIVINVCVLLYGALQLTAGPVQVPGEWAPITAEASTNELRFIPREETRNDSDATIKNYDESTSQKTPSTIPATNHTASSTAGVTELKTEERNARLAPSDDDENILTMPTLNQLKTLLGCNDRDFTSQTLQRGEFWVLKNYIQAEHGNLMCHESITYTTHASYEFLDNVPPLVERWLAPVSLAIFAPGSDFEPTVQSIRYLRDCLGNTHIKEYVTFHLFFSYKHMPPQQVPQVSSFLSKTFNCSETPPYKKTNFTTYMKKNNLLYPVNVARNIARDAALTHFVLPSDIELYPSPNLIPKFLNMIARNEGPLPTRTNPRVFPLTLFEVAANAKVPSTKTELLHMLSTKTAIPFHKFVCPSCHNIPQAQQWMNAKETNQMSVFHVGKRRGKHVNWEPIYIGTHQDPYYDERLSWEGKKDKMTQGYVLCVKDYDFMILNNAFLIHKPGIKRYQKEAKRDTLAGKQAAFVRTRIGPELKKLYGIRNGCAI